MKEKLLIKFQNQLFIYLINKKLIIIQDQVEDEELKFKEEIYIKLNLLYQNIIHWIKFQVWIFNFSAGKIDFIQQDIFKVEFIWLFN